MNFNAAKTVNCIMNAGVATLSVPSGGINLPLAQAPFSGTLTITSAKAWISASHTYGLPLTSTIGSHPAVTYTYDAIGRMTGLTDQANASTSFVYDKRNLLTSKTDRKSQTISYTYTPTDKVDTITYPNSATVHVNYNNLDNLTSIVDSVGTTYFNSYDDADRLLSMTNPHGFGIAYQYDAAGNVTQITYPGTNKTVSYTYDALNRMSTVKINWLSGQPTMTYNYSATTGRLTSITQFNGTTVEYGYDDAARMTSMQNKTGFTVFAGYAFTLDGNGNRTQIVPTEPLTPSVTTTEASYTYNTQKNRLTSYGTNSFTYDYEGQIYGGYGRNYGFDYEHRLTTIDSTSYQYVYDGRGNRIQATRNGTATRYIYDAAGNLIAEVDGSNNITRYYIYGVGLTAMVTPADALYCYHFNATGSTIAITNSSGTVVSSYAYDAFGNITGQSEGTGLSQPFKYVGQYGVMAEAVGSRTFYYMRARYYDPGVGRFISEDPIGFGGGDVNLYAYVANNPIMGIDPSGLYDNHNNEFWRGQEDFNWSKEDDDWRTAPWNPVTGTWRHFRSDIDNIITEIQTASINGNRDAFERAVHDGQDYYAHAYANVGPVKHFFLIISGMNPDANDANKALATYLTQSAIELWETSNSSTNGCGK